MTSWAPFQTELSHDPVILIFTEPTFAIVKLTVSGKLSVVQEWKSNWCKLLQKLQKIDVSWSLRVDLLYGGTTALAFSSELKRAMRERIVFKYVGIKPLSFLALRILFLPWNTFFFCDCILEHPSVSQMVHISYCTACMENALFCLLSSGIWVSLTFLLGGTSSSEQSLLFSCAIKKFISKSDEMNVS